MSDLPLLSFNSGVLTEVIGKGCNELFKIGASDIRIQSDDFVFAYVNRTWQRVSDRRLDDGEMRQIIIYLYKTNSGLGKLGEGAPLDFEVTLQPDPNDPDITLRCRANITSARVGMVASGVSIVLRTIPELPRKWETMGMEQEITDFFFPSQGLVLVIGITGSGKSTLLSSGIRYRIESMGQQIAIGTYEDPIEYIYTRLPGGRMPEVAQIQVKTQLSDFSLVSPNVLRRKYDVVLIGEMRDRESVETGLLVSDTGHATYGTLHAETPATAFARIISEFPHDAQPSIATKLLENTRLIVAQKIERTVDGKGMAFRSWCAFDRALKAKLYDRPYHEWSRAIREHMTETKTTFEHRALGALKDGVIDIEAFQRLASMSPREASAFVEANQ
jgi:defect-in-organelle-trafficking protein DotB